MKTTLRGLFRLSFLLIALACSSSMLLAQDDGGGEGGEPKSGTGGFAPPEDEALDAPIVKGGPFTKDTWPSSMVERPITLARGMLAISSGLNPPIIITAKDFDFDGLSLSFGVSDKLEIHSAIGKGSLYSAANHPFGDFLVIFLKNLNNSDGFRKLEQGVNFRLMSNSSQNERPSATGYAMFALGNTFVSVSRDSGTTWLPDTVGCLGGYPNDIAVDTLQYIYYANSEGLFKQHPDTITWKKIPSFPEKIARTVFVDRKNRLFVSSFSKTYMSTDGGTTWPLDTAGVYGLSATKFCDDVFGNIYALTGSKLYRSLGGKQPWTRIDQPISSLAVDQNNTFLFHSIDGDTIIVAATAFGVFKSTDQGATWAAMKTGLRAGIIYCVVKTKAGKLMTSTNLGIYSHTAGGGPWSKMYPTTGYAGGRPIFQDVSGNLYTLGPKTDYNAPQSPWTNFKSTDGGTTWNPDTAGIGYFRKSYYNYSYYVDETGTQHYLLSDSLVPLYSKPIGQAWAPDTAGFTKKGVNISTAFGSDKRGNFYIATNNLSTFKGTLWKRPIIGGTWAPDTSGLNGEQIYSLAVDKNGNLFAGTFDGVFRKSGGVWTKLPFPSGRDGNNAFVVSVDSSGALLAGFSTFTGFSALWHGVYSTTNNGATWTYVGLDSVAIQQLVSYGDTTYAATYSQGVFKFTRFAATGVERENNEVPHSFVLEQNYPNPFNPATNVRFTIGSGQFVSLKIYDVLGREVTTLVNEKMNPGSYNVLWNGGNYSSGVYFYQLRSGSFVETKKMVLMK